MLRRLLRARSPRSALAALRPPRLGPDYLSGRSGDLSDRRAALARVADRLIDHLDPAPRRLARALQDAGDAPTRRVLVVGIDRGAPDGHMRAARRELARSRHDVRFALAEGTGGRGKFENLNLLLAELRDDDWLLVIDDDVALPSAFLDGMLLVAERCGLRLAQPAHRRWSYAAWPVTRRRPGSIARETGFVEIGPVTLLHASTFDALLPFPDLRMGWGLDAHWAALARRHGWKLGVIDALAVAHTSNPVGSSYSGEVALAEAEAFLATRPHMSRDEMDRTVRTHRSLP